MLPLRQRSMWEPQSRPELITSSDSCVRMLRAASARPSASCMPRRTSGLSDNDEMPSRSKDSAFESRVGVPASTPAWIVIAGTGVEEKESSDAVGIDHMKMQREKPTQGQATDDRLRNSTLVENRGHIHDAMGLRIIRRIWLGLGQAMTPDVPGDDLSVRREPRHVAAPHFRTCSEPMREKQGHLI